MSSSKHNIYLSFIQTNESIAAYTNYLFFNGLLSQFEKHSYLFNFFPIIYSDIKDKEVLSDNFFFLNNSTISIYIIY